MSFTIRKTEYTPLPTGEYEAKVADVTREDGKFGPQVKLQFELSSDPGKVIHGWCSATYSPKSKLWKWTRSILSENPPNFNSDDVLGKPCRLAVVERVGEDGGTYNRIESVLPARF